MENADIWGLVQGEMEPDGSLRDIYILESSLTDWKYFLSSLKAELKEIGFRINEEEINVDDLNLDDHFSGNHEWMLPTLRVVKDNVQLNCHFFTDIEMEFDFDPKEITGIGKMNVILEFMKRLSHSVGKDSILTPENAREYPILRYCVHKEMFEYIPLDSTSN